MKTNPISIGTNDIDIEPQMHFIKNLFKINLLIIYEINQIDAIKTKT